MVNKDCMGAVICLRTLCHENKNASRLWQEQ